MKEYNIKIGTAFLLVLAYFGIMLFYTFLDVVFWRKVVPDFFNIINIVTIAICIGVFIVFLKRVTGYQVRLLSNISFVGMMLGISCSFLFFLLLDRGLDPIFEGMFPQSEQDYQEMLGIYFSGTGNSRYALETFLGKYDESAKVFAIEDENIVSHIKSNEEIMFSYSV